MTIHERLEAFWAGEKPDMIPYTIYQNEWRHTQNDPDWIPLFKKGLGVTWNPATYTTEYQGGVEIDDKTVEKDGVQIRRQTWKTPVGEIFQTWENGWHKRYLLHTENDYRVMTYIVKHIKLKPAYEAWLAKQQEIMPYGVALSHISRTPFQSILVDFAGPEEFSYHLYDYEDAFRELYDALLDQFRHCTQLVAGGPGRYVACLENFTAETVGPQRYEEFFMPVYQECAKVLHQAGKVLGCHYDGRTASCKELIAQAPFDLLESLTEPNEGDQTLAECRAVWPKKLFWSNIRVGDYQMPAAQLAEKVASLVQAAAPDGKRLAFEVSEIWPANWKQSVPVVLDTLAQLA
jgi:hypothetical protein